MMQQPALTGLIFVALALNGGPPRVRAAESGNFKELSRSLVNYPECNRVSGVG